MEKRKNKGDCPMNEKIIVFVTVDTPETGLKISKALVSERLVACVNILPGLRSVYQWKGKVMDEGEQLLIMKTRGENFEPLKNRVLELHPYDCPEIVAFPIVLGHAPYLNWIEEETTG